MADEALIEALIPYDKSQKTHQYYTLFTKQHFLHLPANLRPTFRQAGSHLSSGGVNIRQPNCLTWVSHVFTCSNLGFLFLCGEDSVAYYTELMKVKKVSTALKKLQQIFGEKNVIQANQYRFKFFGLSSKELAYISRNKGSEVLFKNA